MTHKTIVGAIAALCLGLGGAVFAQGHDGPEHDGGHGPQAQRGGPPPHRDARPAYNRHPAPQYNRRPQHDRPGPPEGDVRFHEGRGAGPDHGFYRGGRLPYEYRNRQYVVQDWRGHHLSAPPRGYYWVQTGSDYVLVAIASGIIASILLSN
jgi:Ni/Co efflux regulator RcnB